MNRPHETTEIATRLHVILADLLLLRPEEVAPDRLLVEDLDIDSIALLELSFAIEETFGVEFPHLKMSEETFNLSLPEALSRMETMPGGTTFFEYVKEQVVREVLETGPSITSGRTERIETPSTDGRVSTAESRERVFRAQTVGSLVHTLGGRVPHGLEANASLSTLRLLDLLRLLTVGSLTGYVEHLVASKASHDAATG
jgi:acyl carrier protein